MAIDNAFLPHQIDFLFVTMLDHSPIELQVLIITSSLCIAYLLEPLNGKQYVNILTLSSLLHNIFLKNTDLKENDDKDC